MEIECIGDIDLKDPNAQHRLLFECALDIILLVDWAGDILDANYAAIKAYGYSKDELLRLNARDLRIPGERSFTTEQLKKAYTQGQTFETVHKRKDGNTFPVEVSAQGVIINDKRMLIAVVRDITKRREYEKTIARLAAIVESSDDAIIGMTGDGVITEWNHGANKLYGYTAKEAVGRPISILIPKGREWELPHIIQTIKNGGHIEHFDTLRLRKDGTTVAVSMTASPVRGPRGELLGISWTARDISRRKKVEEDLAEARETAEIYLDLISHDINNLNQTAMGYLELALEAKYLDEAKELIKKPLEALESSSKLIGSVGKLKQTREGALKYQSIDLCNILKDVVEQYSRLSGEGVSISFKPLDKSHVIANDLIRDVFSNLISNAVKHSEGIRPLTIDVSVEPAREDGRKYYRVVVEDNGPGVPDELKPRLFTRFRRGKTKASGKGMGLFLVNTLVKDFHGRVWAEDRVRGDHTQGARFVVLLPAADK